MNTAALSHDFSSDNSNPIVRAEQLIWDLLDDKLPEEGVVELQTIYRDHPLVCEVYIKCMQSHVALNDCNGRKATHSLFPTG